LQVAEDAANGNLDGWTERKPGFYVSPDGKTEIEWQPGGHPTTTGEGPHVTIKSIDPESGKKSVVRKIFLGES